MNIKSRIYLAVIFLTSFSSVVNAQFIENFKFGVSGELHYNEIVNDLIPPQFSSQLDFHKIGIKTGYQITENISVNSELKIEHLFEEKYNNGDVFYTKISLNYKKSSRFGIEAGMISMPLTGSKPKPYGGVETSQVEKYITQSWRELGVSFYGKLNNGISYKANLMTGLEPWEITGKKGIYNAKVSHFVSSMNNFAGAVQLKYQTELGIGFGGSLVYSGLESKVDYGNALSGANYKLVEAFVTYGTGGFSSRATAAYSHITNSDKINNVIGQNIGESQLGSLVEVRYDLLKIPVFGISDQNMVVFTRAEFFDTQYTTSNIEPSAINEHYQYTFGAIYKPVSMIELKADYQILRTEGIDDLNMMNISVGFSF